VALRPHEVPFLEITRTEAHVGDPVNRAEVGSARWNSVLSGAHRQNGTQRRRILGVGENKLGTVTKQRRRPAALARRKNGSNSGDVVEFTAGSLETELAAIGKAVPAREWARVPVDYFANLDHYLHGALKKK